MRFLKNPYYVAVYLTFIKCIYVILIHSEFRPSFSTVRPCVHTLNIIMW